MGLLIVTGFGGQKYDRGVSLCEEEDLWSFRIGAKEEKTAEQGEVLRWREGKWKLLTELF